MHQWMVYFLGLYQEAERTSGGETQKDLAADAAQYINSHYSDVSLSVAQVAESLSISSSYLSRSFQKKYGMSVLQYISGDEMRAPPRYPKASASLVSTPLALQKSLRMETTTTTDIK